MKIDFKNLKLHLKTINAHKRMVRKWCFKMGIPIQGLLHDMSKYSLKELSIYKYYTGVKSPHDAARKELGYSPSWYHHKCRNKHHWEYWVDSIYDKTAVKMPYKYVIEMFCDNVGAGHVYNKEKWEPYMMLEYNKTQDPKRIMNKDSLNLYNFLCDKINELGEVQFVKWYKKNKKEIKKKYERGEI